MTHERDPREQSPAPEWEALEQLLSDELRAEQAYPLGTDPAEIVRRIRAVVPDGERQSVSVAASAGIVHKGELAGMAGGTTVRRLFGALPARRLVSHSFRRAAGLGTALGVAILLVVVTGSYLATRRTAPTPVTVAAAPTEVTTARGQRATVRLPDGSRVVLSADSRVRYARDFGVTSRDVALEGEAYFDVVHDGNAPFRVRTPHGVSEDVGTRFSVRAYGDEPSTRVVVEEGKVAVGHGIILGAGELVRLTAHAPPAVERTAQVEVLLAWTRGQPRFVNTPLRQVVSDVQRWYDVRIELGDEALGNRAVTAAFGQKPLLQMLESLARAVDAHLLWRDQTWVFVPNPEPAARRPADSGSLFR